jgi:hypothetical protein
LKLKFTVGTVFISVAAVKDAEKKLADEKKHIKVPGIDMKTMAVSVLGRDIAGAIQKVACEENVSL